MTPYLKLFQKLHPIMRSYLSVKPKQNPFTLPTAKSALTIILNICLTLNEIPESMFSF